MTAWSWKRSYRIVDCTQHCCIHSHGIDCRTTWLWFTIRSSKRQVCGLANPSGLKRGRLFFFGIVETAERAETIGSSVKPNGDESTACRKHRRNISSAPPTDQYHRRALRTAYHRTTSTTSASATVPWFYSLHKPWSRPPTFGVHIIRG